jgi:TonB family protein
MFNPMSNPMFNPDPANPDSSAEDARADREQIRLEEIADRRDLAELAEKVAVHGHVSAEVSAELALDILLNQIAEQACLATPANGAAIVLARDGEWVCRASAGSNSPILGARLNAEAGLSGESIKTRQIQRCDDAQSDPRADAEACRSLGVRSVLIVPLLQGDEPVGVFEVFSSQPAAFGKRDESTLQILSHRVLSNLEQTLQPFPLAAEIASAEHDEVLQQSGDNLVMHESVSEDSVLENSVADVFVEKEFIEKPSIEKNFTENNFTMTAPHHGLEEAAISQTALPGAAIAEEGPAGEVATGRGVNILTSILGGTVLIFALLLMLSIGLRLIRGKSAPQTHPRASNSAKISDAGRNPVPNAGPTRTAPNNNETKSNLAAGKRAGSGERLSTSESPRASAHESAAGVSAARHPTPAPVKPGSLQVFENGKEIFRLPAGSKSSERSPLGSTAESTAESTVESPSGVERASIYELSPEAAAGSLLHRVEPEYPQEALLRQIQGPVALDVRIAEDGTVQRVKLLSGQPLLADAAIAAVKQWRFRPHLMKGHVVEMQTKVILNFRLPQ